MPWLFDPWLFQINRNSAMVCSNWTGTREFGRELRGACECLAGVCCCAVCECLLLSLQCLDSSFRCCFLCSVPSHSKIPLLVENTSVMGGCWAVCEGEVEVPTWVRKAALTLSHRSLLPIHLVLPCVCTWHSIFLTCRCHFCCAVLSGYASYPPCPLACLPQRLLTVSLFHSHSAGRKLVFSKRPVLLLLYFMLPI